MKDFEKFDLNKHHETTASSNSGHGLSECGEVPQKKIAFCDKCGEAYQTDKEHTCEPDLCKQCHKNEVDSETVNGVLSKSEICRECKELNFKSLLSDKPKEKEESLTQIQVDYYENKLESMFKNQANQEKELSSLRDQLNTEQHLVRVYKIQAECANEQLRNKNELIKEMREALMLTVFYLQDKGLDLTIPESLIKKANSLT